MKFTTRDKDNSNTTVNCAQYYVGAWWFESCFYSHLNGLYYRNPAITFANGVMWNRWKGNRYSLKFTEMKTRRNN